MGIRLRAIALLGLCAVSAPAQTVYSNGLPNGQAGFNIFDDFRAADDFSFVSATSFDMIRFWGLLPTGVAYVPTISWEILRDDGGVPGSVVEAGGSVLAQPTLRATIPPPTDFDSWQFDLHVGPRTLEPTTVFWLALHDGPIGAITSSTLIWEGTDELTGHEAALEFDGQWATVGGNFAFEIVTTAPEPGTLALLATGLVAVGAAARRKRFKPSAAVTNVDLHATVESGSPMLRSEQMSVRTLALVLAAASLALDPRTATAQTGPAVPTTIDACYVPLTGTLYRINTPASPAPGAPSKCSSASHVQFQWNAQGPKGDKGDSGAGLSGFSEVMNEASPPADAGGRRSMNARCPTGKMAIGGSYAIFANGGNYGWGIAPVSSGTFSTSFNPADPHDSFFVLTADAPGYAQVPFFRVIVKCATAP